MSRAGKVWGSTSLLWQSETVEAHLLAIRAGGYCSRHWHSGKRNRFFVVSGRLLVRQWMRKGVDSTELRPGQSLDVPAGTVHQFEAITPAKVVEIAWVELESADIIRQTKGGVRRQKGSDGKAD